MRLIDADKVLKKKFRVIKPSELGVERYYVSEDDINNAPTVDAVPVVRCKDCYWAFNCKGHRHCNFMAGDILDDWYCSHGRRKDGKTE